MHQSLKSTNLLRKRISLRTILESMVFWGFRLMTYLVIAAASFIFLKIAYEGSKTLFTKVPPFINIPFLTEAPETLHFFKTNPGVYRLGERAHYDMVTRSSVLELGSTTSSSITGAEIGGSLVEVAPADREEFSKSNPKADVGEKKIVNFEIKSGVLEVGDRTFRELHALNPGFTEIDHKTQVYASGGIMPCIVGTLLLVLGSMTIALFLGVASAIYLSEYAKQGPVTKMIRLAIMNLSGVPSIVFGLFGYGMFVIWFGWNVSLMAGWFTLAFMVLPIIITASEESLRAVPQGFRAGSLALGASHWQTIRTNVLPYAMPGILTSSVLGIARVAGETAPIMFTAAYVVRDNLPWQVKQLSEFFFQGVQALPYHIFVVSARVPQNEYTSKVQYAAAFVFLALVMSIALFSILMRNHIRKKLQW